MICTAGTTAFGEVAGEDSRRIELLELGQRRFHPLERTVQQFGHRHEVVSEVTRLVQHVDEMKADHPVNGIDKIDVQLGEEVFA